MDDLEGTVEPSPQGREEGPGGECPACGERSAGDARFCQRCGSQLPDYREPAEPGPSPEPSVVSVVVVSIEPGDARTVRRTRASISATLERHGGDLRSDEVSVRAVFGHVPVQGDGALRAARASVEISERFTGDEALGVRIGIATEETADPSGEVPAETAQTLADRAAAGQILITQDAHLRAGPASVDARALDPSGPAEPDADDGSGSAASTLDAPDGIDPLEALEGALDEDEDDAEGEDGDDRGSNDVDGSREPEGDDGYAPGVEHDGHEEDGAGETIMQVLGVVASATGQAPSPRAPLVGRDAERVALREIVDSAIENGACGVVAIVGSPGTGKSRLSESLLAWAEDAHDARTARVRCRDAAEGGAAWPLADLVERVAGIEVGDSVAEAQATLDRILEGEPDAGVVAERLRAILAMPDGHAIVEETGWAIRRLFTCVGKQQPLIVSVDDVDVTDPSFTRLMRTVTADLPAPVVVLLTGRSDPLHGKAEAGVTSFTLEPLEAADVAQLLEHLVGRSAFGERAQHRVATATGGNPFLVEQLTCMLIEEGLLAFEDDTWRPTTDLSSMPTPPNVAALMDARMHGLTPEERVVLERVAVAGARVRWAELLAILPDDLRTTAGDHVSALARRQLLGEHEAGETIQVRHAFVRDAAGRGATAETRAAVHAAAAAWLEATAGDRVDRFGERIGSHLERAFRARSGLGTADARTRDLAAGAAAWLDGAGAGAESLGDANGAFRLAQRAASLLPRDDVRRPELLLRAAIALGDLGQTARADALLTETAHAARASDQRGAEWRAKLLRARFAAVAGSEHRALESARRRAERSVAVFRELGDDVGLAWAWSLSAYVSRCRGHASAYTAAARRAAEAGRAAGRTREEIDALRAYARGLGEGSLPLHEVASKLASIVDRVGDEQRPVAQEALGVLALVQADRGLPDEARAADERASAIVAEIGMSEELAVRAERSGLVRARAGDAEGAEAALREGLRAAEASNDDPAHAHIAANLAHVLEDRGNYGEAMRLTEIAEQLGSPHDLATRVRWRTARARALAYGGSLRPANLLARDAVLLADQTDGIALRAHALIELAEVLRLSGRRNEAHPLVRRALRAYTRTGAQVLADQARQLLDGLDPANDPPAETPGSDLASTATSVDAAGSPQVEYAHVASGDPAAPVPPPAPASAPAPSGGAMSAQVGESPPGIVAGSFEQEFAGLQVDEHPLPQPVPTPTEGQGERTGQDAGQKERKGLRFW